ncbi:MAG: hypothetical protein ABIJ34_00050 [archaeon]
MKINQHQIMSIKYPVGLIATLYDFDHESNMQLAEMVSGIRNAGTITQRSSHSEQDELLRELVFDIEPGTELSQLVSPHLTISSLDHILDEHHRYRGIGVLNLKNGPAAVPIRLQPGLLSQKVARIEIYEGNPYNEFENAVRAHQLRIILDARPENYGIPIIRKEDSIQITGIFNPNERFEGNERAKIVRELTLVARDGFGTDITEDAVDQRALDVDFLYLIRANGEAVGFAGYDIYESAGTRSLVLEGIVIKRSHQKKGLFTTINNMALATHDYDYLVMRTQSEVIAEATRSLVKNLYPMTLAPANIREIAMNVAVQKMKMTDFNPMSFISRGTYGQSLYDQPPIHHTSNGRFYTRFGLDVSKGDSMILVGELK